MTAFTERLKTALVGDRAACFVYLGNFEVEREWARGEVGLPVPAGASPNRMDELALLLAGAGDVVVLKAAPDPGYLDYLSDLGLPRPVILAAARCDSTATVSVNALADESLTAQVKAAAGHFAYLLAHGNSPIEEELADRWGLRLAGAPAPAAKTVNSKVYSRQLAGELGLRQPAGWGCETLADLDRAVTGAGQLLAQGRRVAVKDAYGVSGKGMVVIDQVHRLVALRRMVTEAARRRGSDRIAIVIEEWVEQGGDLACHLTLSSDGTVEFDAVGEAIVTGGVHQGNRVPARLTAAQQQQLRVTAEEIGARLVKDGYHGVVGVDAMLDLTGGLYPVNEINARNTMLTYLLARRDRLVDPGLIAFARHYPVRVPVSFDELHGRLADLLLRRPGGTGVVLNTFATASTGSPGRLYVLLAGTSAEHVAHLDTAVAHRLAGLAGGDHGQ